MSYNKSPIIVSGMHRSGTSLLTRILIDMNVFMGCYHDDNSESIFFQRLNRWIMSCNSSSWDDPKSFRSVQKKDLKIIENKITKSLNSRSTNFIYFGMKRSLINHTFKNINYNWGWKDPSNTFTLPLWMNIFNNSKIIYMLRHPIDVSNSLLYRNEILKKEDSLNINKNVFSKYLSLLTINRGGISSSFDINNLDDCLNLYNKYYNEIMKINDSQNKVLFIKYEDLLLNTKVVLNDICKYLNISNELNYSEIISKIDKNKAYSYRAGQTDFNFSEDLINIDIYNE